MLKSKKEAEYTEEDITAAENDKSPAGPRRGGPMGNVGPVRKAKDMKGTVRRLLGYLRPYRLKLVLVGVLIIAATLTSVAGTRILGIAIDEYIMVGNFSGLWRLCLLLAGVYLMASLFTWLQNLLMIHVAQDTVAGLRQEVFDKFQKLPLRYFDQRETGELMSRVTNDVDNVSTALNSSVAQIFSSVLTILATLGMMLYLSPLLTLFSLVTIPILMLVVQKVMKKARKYFVERQRRLGRLNGRVEEVISGQKVVKVFTREELEIENFRTINEDLRHVGFQAEVFSGMIGPISMALNNLGYTLVAAAGGVMAVMGAGVTVGIISDFLIYSRQFSRPLNELANQFNTIMAGIAGAERVFEILDQTDEPADEPDAVELTDVKGRVVLEDVNFSYDQGHPILKHINLYAEPGQTIALVGPTGAGKTTIINLLTRFYDINQGTIAIDGIPITHIKRDSLRQALGIVLQDTYLFTGTIRDNIRYGRRDATDEEIKQASKLANAHEFIKRLPQGYDTVLADGGGNLSQGQRQMLSIARAILADPAILILDEATSNVDTRTEVKIQQAMQNLMHGRTNFVIAHRLSTIRNADLIAVIDHGEIIERGNHEALLAKKGFYYRLYTSQFAEQEPA